MTCKNILSVDIGTTSVKMIILSGDPCLYRVVRFFSFESHVTKYNGTGISISIFLNVCKQIKVTIQSLARTCKFNYIGLTGIREGLVMLNSEDDVVWVSGNGYILNTDDLNYSVNRKYIASLIGLGRKNSLLTLQGYLGYLMTGVKAITSSEIFAWGYSRVDDHFNDVSVRRCKVGEPIARHMTYRNVSVFLAGTDEQASCYGLDIEKANNITVTTGTFWNIARQGHVNTTGKLFRHIYSSYPYPAATLFIGIRWGELLGIKKDCSLIHYKNKTTLNENVLVKEMKLAFQELHIDTSRSSFTISGGGVRYHSELIQNIFRHFNARFRMCIVDSTALGVLKLSHKVP